MSNIKIKITIIDILKLTQKYGFLKSFYFCCSYLKGGNYYFDGIQIRKKSSDLAVFKQVFIWEEYKFPLEGEIKIIIDAGSNIGCSSIWFSKEYKQATILSLEPEKNNFNILSQNVSKYPQIIPLNYALWNKDCNLRIENANDENWSFRFIEASSEIESGFDAISINSLIKKYKINKIDILKIDIETSEKYLFDGDYRSWLPLTKYIFIETHDFILKGCSKAVTGAIFELDFSMYVSGENLVFVNNNL